MSGALVADGLLEKKIVFTSFQDDQYGGDNNNDGGNTAPANGNWGGIEFVDSLTENILVLRHAIVRYGGANNSGNLYFNAADILMENSEISNSSSHGIRVYNSSPAIVGNRIWGNSIHGINVDQPASNPNITFNRITSNLADGIHISNNANAIAINNQFLMNRGFGLRNSTGNTVDASQSWWGDTDSTGPLQQTTNPSGTGNQVSDNVTYNPILTTISTNYSYINFSDSSPGTAGNLSPAVLVQGIESDEWDPGNLRPDRTMAHDPNEIIVDFTGLDPANRYKARVSYYNGDAAAVVQSLADGNGDPIHASQPIPSSAPVQYEYRIPESYYDNANGDLRLIFVHDNAASSLRAAIPEIWLIEDIQKLVPPRMDLVEYNDLDGSGGLSTGDEYHIHFSAAMETDLIADATTDAN